MSMIRRQSSSAESAKFDPYQHQEFVDAITTAEYVETYQPAHQLGPDHIIDTDVIYTWQPDGATRIPDPETFSKLKPKSVVTALTEVAKEQPDLCAMAVKRDGEWQKWSYAEYLRDVRTVAKAWIKLGLKPFHSVSVIGFNSPEWFLSDLGAIFAGGIATGVYATNSPEACHHVLFDSQSQIVVVEDEKQLKKILQIKNRLPELKAIVQYIGEPSRSDVLSWSDVMEIGSTLPDEILDRRIKGISINQCCTLVYTSGTTGNPKGVMSSHDYYNFAVTRLFENFGGKMPGSRIVSYLPLNHTMAQIIDLHGAIIIRASVYFAQPDALKGSLRDTLVEVKPTHFLGVPRVWEKFYVALCEKESTLPFVTKALLSMAKNIGYKTSIARNKGSKTLPFGYGFARPILKKIQAAIGLDEAKVFLTGSAPIDKNILEYYQCLMIPLTEGYGMSETSACNASKKYDNVIGSVGKSFPDMEVKLFNVDQTGEGEVCMRGRNRFMGYFRDEAKTKETIDEEGWCHSGDLGRMEEGRLYITGRIKELVITAGGENVPPVYIEENIKKELPALSNVMVVGDRRKFLGVLITIKCEIDPDTGAPLGKLAPVALDWCASLGLGDATSVQDVIFEKTGVVHNSIKAGIDRANEHAVSNAQKIQKFTILPIDFSVQGEELGPTLKLKRSFVMNKYKDVIDKMYPD